MHWSREKDIVIAAVMFYTRLPCPKSVDSSEEVINKSRKYLPLIGWLVGGLGVAAFALASTVLPVTLAVLLSIVVTIIATGAFHEDGFADSCDAFGGGWNQDQVLAIMKDSRVGAYALAGFVLLILIKFFSLYELALHSTSLMLVTYLNAHISSRFIASMVIQTHDYVREVDTSKAKPAVANPLSLSEMSFSAAFMVIAWLLWWPNMGFILAIILAYIVKVLLCAYFKRRIGGYTGDCLGAVQQLTEVVIYLSVLALSMAGVN